MAKRRQSTQQPSKIIDGPKINKSWDTPSRPITPTPANTGPSDTPAQPQPAKSAPESAKPVEEPTQPAPKPQSGTKK